MTKHDIVFYSAAPYPSGKVCSTACDLLRVHNYLSAKVQRNVHFLPSQRILPICGKVPKTVFHQDLSRLAPRFTCRLEIGRNGQEPCGYVGGV